MKEKDATAPSEENSEFLAMVSSGVSLVKALKTARRTSGRCPVGEWYARDRGRGQDEKRRIEMVGSEGKRKMENGKGKDRER